MAVAPAQMQQLAVPPACTSAAARAMPGWKRWLKPTFTRRPLACGCVERAVDLAACRARRASPPARARRRRGPARPARPGGRGWSRRRPRRGSAPSRSARLAQAAAAVFASQRSRRLGASDVVAADDLVRGRSAAARLRADAAAADDSHSQRRATHAYSLRVSALELEVEDQLLCLAPRPSPAACRRAGVHRPAGNRLRPRPPACLRPPRCGAPGCRARRCAR